MTLGKIGARSMMCRWRNPYVTDGLIAMWDGEWNIGGGVHDANATTWVDLVGGASIQLSPADCTIEAASITTTAGHQLAVAIPALANDTYSEEHFITIEAVVAIPTTINVTPFLQLGGRSMCTYADAGASIRTEYGLPAANGTSVMLCYTATKVTRSSLNDITARISVVPKSGVGSNSVVINGSTVSISRRSPSTTDVQINDLILGFAETGVLTIGNIRIYRGYLSDANVAANYAIDKARFNLP